MVQFVKRILDMVLVVELLFKFMPLLVCLDVRKILGKKKTLFIYLLLFFFNGAWLLFLGLIYIICFLLICFWFEKKNRKQDVK